MGLVHLIRVYHLHILPGGHTEHLHDRLFVLLLLLRVFSELDNEGVPA